MPATLGETMYTVICSAFGIFMFAFVVGAASNSLAEIDALGQEERQRLKTLDHFMRFRKVPHSLHTRILSYYQYMSTSMHGDTGFLDDLVTQLPTSLHRQLIITLNRKLFINVRIFHMCDSSVTLDLAERLTPKIAMPNEYLLRVKASWQTQESHGCPAARLSSSAAATVCLAAYLRPQRIGLHRLFVTSGHPAGIHRRYLIREGALVHAIFLLSRGHALVLKTAEEAPAPAPSPIGSLLRSGTRKLDAALPGQREGLLRRRAARREEERSHKADTPKFHSTHEMVVSQLMDFDSFGEEPFLSRDPSSVSVKAVSYCDLMMLTLEAFEEVKARNSALADALADASTISGLRGKDKKHGFIVGALAHGLHGASGSVAHGLLEAASWAHKSEHDAAIKIQSIVRGGSTRFTLEAQKSKARLHGVAAHAGPAVNVLSEAEAAVKIQSIVRGRGSRCPPGRRAGCTRRADCTSCGSRTRTSPPCRGGRG